ncbi:MAG: hypothetical protein WCF93_03445 [Candidatus Moraniibacteriota bacterium]
MKKKILQAATFTLFLHSFAGWFYIAENAVFHPETLAWGLTHFAPWPREDTFGIFCFAISIISLFIFMLLRDEK